MQRHLPTQSDRDKIAHDMAEYLKRGGKIKQCTSADNRFADHYQPGPGWQVTHKDPIGPVPMAIHRSSKYPWSKLEVGQSFWVGGKQPQYMRDQARDQQRRHGTEYECRNDNGGTRVTRVK